MANYDPRVDAYIAKAAAFAQPILEKFRELVHSACPDVEENIKWGMPAFEYQGPLCGMASFKAHCSINFWKAQLLKNGSELFVAQGDSMGQLGRITQLKDLPSDKKLLSIIKEATRLNVDGIKVQKTKPGKAVVPRMPSDFKKILASDKTALQNFEAFAPSARKDYIVWIEDAKTDTTRQKRMQQALEWIREGKSRNWKYK